MNGTEHLASEGDDEPLSDEHQGKHQYHTFVFQEVAEGSAIATQRLGIEEIPELYHHESSEEDGQLMHIHASLASSLTVNEHGKHHDEEGDATEENAESHTLVDDEVGSLAWLIVHHLMRWRQ